jgi:hypothetical protein
MPRGGNREGAGRPEGSTGKRNKELQELVEKQGDLSPGRVMLECMWYHHEEVGLMRQDPSFSDTREGRKLMKEFDKNLMRVAKYAAPYIHPKLRSCHGIDESAEVSPEHETVCDPLKREPFPTSDEIKKMDVVTLVQLYRDEIARQRYEWEVEQAEIRDAKRRNRQR